MFEIIHELQGWNRQDEAAFQRIVRKSVSMHSAAIAPFVSIPGQFEIPNPNVNLRLIPVTPESPMEYKLLLERACFSFRWETAELEQSNFPRLYNCGSTKEYAGWLICLEPQQHELYRTLTPTFINVGGLVMQRYRRFGQWTLLWIWLHPTVRGTPCLNDVWQFLEGRYPNFFCDPPYSAAITASAERNNLILRDYSEPAIVFNQRTVNLLDESAVVIREATIGDVALLQDQNWFSNTDPQSCTEFFLGTRKRQQNLRLLLALNDASVVGHVWVDLAHSIHPTAAANTGVVDHLNVIEAFRGRGLGTFLVQSAEQSIRNADLEISEIGCEVQNTNALRIYLKLGYRRLDQTLHTGGPAFGMAQPPFTWGRYENCILMFKNLAEPVGILTDDQLNQLVNEYTN